MFLLSFSAQTETHVWADRGWSDAFDNKTFNFHCQYKCNALEKVLEKKSLIKRLYDFGWLRNLFAHNKDFLISGLVLSLCNARKRPENPARKEYQVLVFSTPIPQNSHAFCEYESAKFEPWKARDRGEHERVIIPPVIRGFGGLPENFFEFWALLCAFLMGFYAFGTRF